MAKTKKTDYTSLVAKLAVIGKLPPLQLDALAWSAAHIVEQKLDSPRKAEEGAEEGEETAKGHKEEGEEATKEKQVAQALPTDFRKDAVYKILATMVELHDKGRKLSKVNATEINNAWDTSNPFFNVESQKVRELIPSAIRIVQECAGKPQEIKEPQDRPLESANATRRNPANMAATPRESVQKALFPKTIDIELLRQIASGGYPLRSMSKDDCNDFFIAVAAYFIRQTKATYKDIGAMAGHSNSWHSQVTRTLTSVSPEAFERFAKAAVMRLENPETSVTIKPKKRIMGKRMSDSERGQILSLIEPKAFTKIVQTAYPDLDSIDVNPLRVMNKEALLHIATSDNALRGMSPADIRKTFVNAAAFYKETMQPTPTVDDLEWMAELNRGGYGNIKYHKSPITREQFVRFAKIATAQLIAMSQKQEQEAEPNGHAHTNGNVASVENGTRAPWSSRSASGIADKRPWSDDQKWAEYVLDRDVGDVGDKTRST